MTLRDVRQVQGPNYFSTMAEMQVKRGGAEVAVLFPEKRVYPVQAMPTTEAAIDYGLFRDVYLVIGDPQANGGWAFRGYIKPFANWLWIGSRPDGAGRALESERTGAIGWPPGRAGPCRKGCRRNDPAGAACPGLTLALAVPAGGVQPDEMLADPALEARAREISRDVRCPVCQGETIDDSNAQISRDLRIIIRERLVAGDSNEEVIAFLVARYGEFVLYDPPKTGINLVLWLAGPAMLLPGPALPFWPSGVGPPAPNATLRPSEQAQAGRNPEGVTPAPDWVAMGQGPFCLEYSFHP